MATSMNASAPVFRPRPKTSFDAAVQEIVNPNSRLATLPTDMIAHYLAGYRKADPVAQANHLSTAEGRRSLLEAHAAWIRTEFPDDSIPDLTAVSGLTHGRCKICDRLTMNPIILSGCRAYSLGGQGLCACTDHISNAEAIVVANFFDYRLVLPSFTKIRVQNVPLRPDGTPSSLAGELEIEYTFWEVGTGLLSRVVSPTQHKYILTLALEKVNPGISKKLLKSCVWHPSFPAELKDVFEQLLS
jgi:hypothetical protein